MSGSDRGLPVGVGANDPLDRVLDDDRAPIKVRRLLATLMIGGTTIGGGGFLVVLTWLGLTASFGPAIVMAVIALAIVAASMATVIRKAWRFGFVEQPTVDDEALRMLQALGPVGEPSAVPTTTTTTTAMTTKAGLPTDEQMAALLRQDH